MALLRDQMKQELVRKQQAQRQPPGYRQMEAGAPPQAGEGNMPTNATPEEQAIYDKVVMAGQKLLYSEETHPRVMKILASKVRPSEKLSTVVAIIIKEIEDRTKDRGGIPDTVVLPAAMELMDLAAEMAAAAGLFEVTPDIAAEATKMLVTNLGEHYGINPEEIKELLMQIPPDQFRPAAGESVEGTVGFIPGRPDHELATEDLEGPQDEMEEVE